MRTQTQSWEGLISIGEESIKPCTCHKKQGLISPKKRLKRINSLNKWRLLLPVCFWCVYRKSVSLTMVICSWVCPVIMAYIRTMLSRMRMICVASTWSLCFPKRSETTDDYQREMGCHSHCPLPWSLGITTAYGPNLDCRDGESFLLRK